MKRIPAFKTSNTARLAEFVASATPPAAALSRAASAIRDTVGVALAGAGEPASRIAQTIAAAEGEGSGPCMILGTGTRTSSSWAAFANGIAAHALDFDDMCFVSLAHPSCALFPAALAACERSHAPGRSLLEGYVVGFELECRLGLVMNPRHYHERGWHCTSTIGTIGAAAAAARVLGLSPVETGHALGIAASSACGLKENLGSMVKPLHAGMAARNGIMAAILAQRGYLASDRSLDGRQGFLAAMDAQNSSLDNAVIELGSRWEILTTGITVKLYPSCAATHPTLDVLLDLRSREGFGPHDVESIDVEVDSMTPRLLIHDRPSAGLEAKFSMPFCAAAAIVDGHVGIGTFEADRVQATEIRALMPRVSMRVNPEFDTTAPLSHTRVTIRLHDGRVLTQAAAGARGYPARPASEDQLRVKFLECTGRALSLSGAERVWEALAAIGDIDDMASFGELFAPALQGSVS
jgi:2-methylcitrate dehydratase PrpD